MAFVAAQVLREPVQLELLVLPPIPTFDVEELEAYWGNETNFAFAESAEGPFHFPDGTRWVACTNWARYVRRAYGAAAHLYGFDDEENPTSLIARRDYGHDFAVVGKRYIVDGWLPNVGGYSRRAVHDLYEPRDMVEIARLYGEPELWMTDEFRNYGLESTIDGELAEDRQRALRSVAVAPGPRVRRR